MTKLQFELTDILKGILKEEAYKYASHYGRDYIEKAKDEPISYKEHYKKLKFNKPFYESIVFNHEEFMRFLSDKKSDIALGNQHLTSTEKLEEDLEHGLIIEVAHEYKKQYGTSYLELIEDALADLEEDLEWAKNDEEYHEKRLYIGEEELIGGPVSEEERERCIKDAQKEQEKINIKINHLKKLEKEIKYTI